MLLLSNSHIYISKPTYGKQTLIHQTTFLRKHSDFDTPSPSWVLFEADEATTTLVKRNTSMREQTSLEAEPSRRSLQVKPQPKT